MVLEPLNSNIQFHLNKTQTGTRISRLILSKSYISWGMLRDKFQLNKYEINNIQIRVWAPHLNKVNPFKMKSISLQREFCNILFLPYTKHCATNLHFAYTFSIFSGAMYSPCDNLKMFFFLSSEKQQLTISVILSSN